MVKVLDRNKNDLRELSVKMDKLAVAVKEDINALVKEITIQTVATLARNTPIDVGTARSNWLVSLGNDAGVTRAAFYAYPSRWRPVPGQNPGGSFGEGRNTAGATWSATGAVAGRETDQDVYIANNLPYIARLNEGWSNQAPAGFVESSITSGVNQAIRNFKFVNIERLF